MKHPLPLPLRLVAVFVLLQAAYLLLGGVAYLVPDSRVQAHLEQTLARGDLAKNYPTALIPRVRCQQDNFTDAIICNQALNLRREGAAGILLVPRRVNEGSGDEAANLAQSVADLPDAHYGDYARYWHGSTFVARLLLAFMDYLAVRYLLYVVSSLLLLWMLLRMWRNGWRAAALAVAYSLMMVNVAVMQHSMQFVQVLLIASAGILALCYRPRPSRPFLAMLFLCLGSVTAYLDLITVPSLTLGLPLAVLLCASPEPHLGRGLRRLVTVAAVWLAGYAATWAAKWGLATVLTGVDVFADATGEAQAWTEGSARWIARALVSNLAQLRWAYVLVPVLLLGMGGVLFPRRQGLAVAVQLLVVAAIPIAYYVLMARAAWEHSWFNYRALATSVAALLMALASVVDWPSVRLKLFPRRDE